MSASIPQPVSSSPDYSCDSSIEVSSTHLVASLGLDKQSCASAQRSGSLRLWIRNAVITVRDNHSHPFKETPLATPAPKLTIPAPSPVESASKLFARCLVKPPQTPRHRIRIPKRLPDSAIE